jgi:hypothetical protein
LTSDGKIQKKMFAKCSLLNNISIGISAFNFCSVGDKLRVFLKAIYSVKLDLSHVIWLGEREAFEIGVRMGSGGSAAFPSHLVLERRARLLEHLLE